MITLYAVQSKPKPKITLVNDQDTVAPPRLVHEIRGYIIRNVAHPLRLELPEREPAK